MALPGGLRQTLACSAWRTPYRKYVNQWCAQHLHVRQGFIFPLGVFTTATIRLAATLPSVVMAYLSLVFIGALVVLWVGVAAGTLQVGCGRRMQNPCHATRPRRKKSSSKLPRMPVAGGAALALAVWGVGTRRQAAGKVSY